MDEMEIFMRIERSPGLIRASGGNFEIGGIPIRGNF